MFTSLKKLLARQAAVRRAKNCTRRFSPALEALEDRQLLSVSSNFSAGVLTLTGNGRNDAVNVSLDGNGRITGSASGIRRIDQTDVRKLVINTGGGADAVNFTLAKDLVRNFDLEVHLGAGNDKFNGVLKGDIKDTKMSIRVDGEAGRDTIKVDARQDVDITPSGQLLMDLNGSDLLDLFSPDDNIQVRYRGQLQGILDVDMSGGLGRDTLFAELRLDSGSTGRIGQVNDAAFMDGGLGSDRLTFKISDNNQAVVSARMQGGNDLGLFPGIGENDVGTHTTNVVVEGGLEHENIVTL
jgi:hypothetical protein